MEPVPETVAVSLGIPAERVSTSVAGDRSREAAAITKAQAAQVLIRALTAH
jgi:hypothetical protein